MEETYTTDFEKRKLKTQVEEILKVSTIPTTLNKVLSVVDDDHSSTSDLAKAIEHDHALTSRIVGMANSSFYNYNRSVKTIPGAISMLGSDMVRNLTISATLFNPGNNADLSHLKALWRHSFEVATAAALIAARTGTATKEDAFLAGLINDLGRAILYQLFGEVYVNITNYGKNGFLVREEEAFGANHTEVGKWFLEKYKFPKDYVLATEHHHSPETFLANYKDGSLQLIPIAYLADLMVSTGKDGFEYDLMPSANHTEIMESIYFDEEGLKEVREEFEAKMEETGDFFD
jgi:putative nucleotidyltransferase with HDIG domain